MKNCKILGFGSYQDKDTQEQKLRIIIAYDSKNEKYYGLSVAAAFLDYDASFERQLKNYVDNESKYNATYEVSQDIGTKTKITKIIINEK